MIKDSFGRRGRRKPSSLRGEAAAALTAVSVLAVWLMLVALV
jgi:hypothetical protein